MTGTMTAGTSSRRNSWRPFLWGGAACLLLLPAIAMRFEGSGVAWTLSDFVLMGMLLATGCALVELGAWLSGSTAYRAGFALAVLTGFMTVWVNLAVGMLGDGPINLIFGGVLLVAAIGAIAARFKAPGMATAMLAAAIAQVACVIAAWWLGGFEMLELVLTALFALPWLASALLFRKAASV